MKWLRALWGRFQCWRGEHDTVTESVASGDGWGSDNVRCTRSGCDYAQSFTTFEFSLWLTPEPYEPNPDQGVTPNPHP